MSASNDATGGQTEPEMDVLTRDNPLLSRPKTGAEEAAKSGENDPVGNHELAPFCAIDCRDDATAKVSSYVEAGIAPATRRAYQSDLAHFHAWGGSVPATDAQIASYLADHAGVLSVATLTRRLAAISVAHEAHKLPNPVQSPLVRATMRGIRREHGIAQRQAKPLLRDDLFDVLGRMGDRPKDLRDMALLLIGFAGGFRRSELCAIDCIDIEHVRQGVIITVRRSKTDQEGVGRPVGIPFGRTKWCPVAALDRWLSTAGIDAGPIFRRVDRHGRVSPDAMSPEAVCLVVRERVAAAGFDPAGYSGHSLRAGFATSAVRAGVSTLKVRAQTGHASDVMLSRYIRDGELFVDNAASRLL
jgi:integrase